MNFDSFLRLAGSGSSGRGQAMTFDSDLELSLVTQINRGTRSVPHEGKFMNYFCDFSKLAKSHLNRSERRRHGVILLPFLFILT